MDTHRSFEARPRHASPHHASPSVRQQHLSLDIAPLPLKTHRPSQGPLMAEESAGDTEGLIQMVYAIYPVLYVWDVDIPLNSLFSMYVFVMCRWTVNCVMPCKGQNYLENGYPPCSAAVL